MEPQTVYIKRTETDGLAPTGLAPGELAVEMGQPTRLWVGVPLSIDVSGRKLLSSTVLLGDAPPADPTPGLLWWEADTGFLWMYYVDANSAQWVMAAGSGGGGSGEGGTPMDAYTKGEADARFVNIPGDVMTGNLAIQSNSGGSLTLKNLTNNSGLIVRTDAVQNIMEGLKNNLMRWSMAVGDAAAESTGNAGSDFVLSRFNDGGVQIGTYALKIIRSSASAMFGGQDVTIGTGSPGSSALLKLNMGTSSGGGNANAVWGSKAGVLRWNMQVGDQTTESGSDSGCNFALTGYSDSGNGLGNHLEVRRSDGFTKVAGALECNGVIASHSNANIRIYTSAGRDYFQASNTAWIFHDETGGNLWNIVAGGTVQAFWRASDAAFFQQGFAYKPGGGMWADSSDARIKNVRGDYTNGLDSILSLKPKRFTFKGNDTTLPPAHTPQAAMPGVDDEPETRTDPVIVPYENSPHHKAAVDAREYVGLVAQEVEAAFPEMVTKASGFINGLGVTDLRNLDATPLIYALINSVKELAAKNDVLAARILALEGKR